jgi:hypothetical protein
MTGHPMILVLVGPDLTGSLHYFRCPKMPKVEYFRALSFHLSNVAIFVAA